MTPPNLPCGRDPIDVWDHAAADHLDSHEQTCTYCQGVISEYRLVAEPLRRWRDQPIQAPPTLLERVMTSVRAGLLARNYLPLASPGGPVNLDTVTAQAALRWSVDQLPDARARSCDIHQRPNPADNLDGGPPRAPAVDIDLSVTARFGVDLTGLAADVRHLVATVAADILGIDVVTVNIVIVDVYEQTAPTASPTDPSVAVRAEPRPKRTTEEGTAT